MAPAWQSCFGQCQGTYFGGACFNGSEANGWLHKGLDILAEQLAEQILSDGGHFERSPMYHAIILEDMLDVLNLAKALPDRFVERSDIVVTSVQSSAHDSLAGCDEPPRWRNQLLQRCSDWHR